jgi:hypothetical protein
MDELNSKDLYSPIEMRKNTITSRITKIKIPNLSLILLSILAGE